MQIRVGFEMIYDCPQPTPMILNLNVHFTRVSDLVGRDDLMVDPSGPDGGLSRQLRQLVHPHRRAEGSHAHLRGCHRARHRDARRDRAATRSSIAVPDLPEETLLFLLGSRYCETDRLSETAWSLFGQTPTGWGRVQAICDYVHRHITFGYEHARMTRTALEAFHDQTGVCRDYAHLAVAFCRCMNIPARYCTGYLGDIGVPPPHGAMDFAAWFEVFLGGRWHTFDARNNEPRIGRVLIARGRDASDVAISSTFGPNTLTSFKVWTDEVTSDRPEPSGLRARTSPPPGRHLRKEGSGMELPRRTRGDELLPPGELTRLRERLRIGARSHDLSTVIACAFDHRTRMLPFIFADTRMIPAGVRAIGSALVDAGFDQDPDRAAAVEPQFPAVADAARRPRSRPVHGLEHEPAFASRAWS